MTKPPEVCEHSFDSEGQCRNCGVDYYHKDCPNEEAIRKGEREKAMNNYVVICQDRPEQCPHRKAERQKLLAQVDAYMEANRAKSYRQLWEGLKAKLEELKKK